MCATIRRHLFPWTMPEWVVMSGIDRRRMGRRAGLHWGAIIGAVMGLCLIIWSISIQGSRRRGPVRQLNWKLLSASCPMRPADPGDRRRSLNQVSFATFNVEWLFKWGGNGSLRCPGTRCPWADEVAAEEHLERVAQTIYNLDADVVNLVELESCQILGYLLSKMPPNHGYLPYVIGSRDTATGQTLGLLTRVDPIADLVISNERVKTPVAGSICPNANDGEVGRTGSTKHYATRISFANQKGQSKTFVFAGLHFLSGPQNKAVCQRREGQAEVVRNLVRRTQQPGDAVIITGDFNDLDNNCLGTDGQTSISAVILQNISSSYF